MISKKIRYVDFDGIEREDVHYFNLNSREYVKLSAKYMSKDGSNDMEEYLKNVIQRKNAKEIVDFIEDVILSSYGVRSKDGKSFVKNDEVRSNFENSFAYAELFETLMKNPEEMKKFAEGLIKKREKRESSDLESLTVLGA